MKADDAEILAASNSGCGVPPLLGSIPPASSSKVYDTSTRPEEPQGGPAARTRNEPETSTGTSAENGGTGLRLARSGVDIAERG
ncbi:hypothetical protein [Streptomyces sp. NBC_00453]|uniref:hypothetical protein n=1 Tax=Streptomyces sp. NBC_00453 TaxID=2903653 RepID=UPI002E1CC303